MSFSRNFIKSELEVVTTEYPPVLHQRKSIANVRRNIIVKMRSIDEDDAESLSIQRRKNFLGIADDVLNYVFHSGSGDISSKCFKYLPALSSLCHFLIDLSTVDLQIKIRFPQVNTENPPRDRETLQSLGESNRRRTGPGSNLENFKSLEAFDFCKVLDERNQISFAHWIALPLDFELKGGIR